MSWKLTKKLKDTHLNNLASTFSRSPSTTTLTDKAAERPNSPPNEGLAGASFNAPSQVPGQRQLNPGILIVTLHEGHGIAIPQSAPGAGLPDASLGVGSYHRNARSPASPGMVNQSRLPATAYMPYAILEFDKIQVFVNPVQGSPENPQWAGSNTHYKFDVSRDVPLMIYLYVRNPHAPPGSGRSSDIFLGVIPIQPRFEEYHQTAYGSAMDEGKASKKSWGKSALARPPSRDQPARFGGVDWFDLQHGTGKLRVGVEYAEQRAGKLTIDDFDLLKVVGKGSFGKVMQVQKKDTGRIYALKTIRKAHIISRSEVTHTLAERSVLAQIDNPFIVPLKFSFQSPEKLYFVLAFVNGGELFHHLQREHRFDINRSRFYTAELLCALECLHGFNVIYRDLKPENILLDYQGHIALCDFGLCKLDMKDGDRTTTFCGTPEYLAPELLTGGGYNKTVDWWTLGVLLYEMLTGLPPFYDENTNEMYRKIVNDPLQFPGPEIVPPPARDLLTRLLNRDPKARLGANGSAEIKAHPFFNLIDWRKLLDRKYEPAFKPNVANALDTANFDPEFTKELPQDSYVEGPVLSQTLQNQFTGFSYNRPVAGLGEASGSVIDPSFVGGGMRDH